MRLNEYQNLSKRTLPEGEFGDKLTNYALGLVGEAAEVSEHIKKVIYHGHDLDARKLKEELGDVCHYVAGLATFLGLTLEDVGYSNVKKLEKRYKDGFSEEASRNRVI